MPDFVVASRFVRSEYPGLRPGRLYAGKPDLFKRPGGESHLRQVANTGSGLLPYAALAGMRLADQLRRRDRDGDAREAAAAAAEAAATAAALGMPPGTPLRTPVRRRS